MTGLTRETRLSLLAEQLSPRDVGVVRDVVRLRFISAGQLARLHFAVIEVPATRTRRTTRTLARLRAHGLLRRLERRIGGVQGGSRGFIYMPSREAVSLVRFLDGEGLGRPAPRHEPGRTFVLHAIDCAELYARLVEAARKDELELLEHQAEPAAWRQHPGAMGGLVWLRPDAFVALGVKEYEIRTFIEVDRGSEGSTTLRRKLAAYLDYYRSGREQQAHQVFPQVYWQCPTARRVRLLDDLIAELPETAQALFLTGLAEQTIDALMGRRRKS